MLIERFYNNIDCNQPETNTCWEWIGGYDTNKCGLRYGYFWTTHKKKMRAHRFSWEYFNKQEIPEGLVVRHLCNNSLCVNPGHLAIGTAKENVNDSINNIRRGRAHTRPHQKYSEDSIKSIKESTLKNSELEKLTGIPKQYMSSIRTGRVWGWL